MGPDDPDATRATHGPHHKVPPQLLVVEVVGEEVQHLGFRV